MAWFCTPNLVLPEQVGSEMLLGWLAMQAAISTA